MGGMKIFELKLGSFILNYVMASTTMQHTGTDMSQAEFRSTLGRHLVLVEWLEIVAALVYLGIVNVVFRSPNAVWIAGLRGHVYPDIYTPMDLGLTNKAVGILCGCDTFIFALTCTVVAYFLKLPLVTFLLQELDVHGGSLIGPFYTCYIVSFCVLHLHCGNDPTFRFAWGPF
eukprot:NODE_4285_length_689_cov_265.376972.p1 GENE.NODE_4285_length_689_cov_265.376972~~NODE_4285_length_689_cov_265.376972.p1  ORF type:complete len:173 (+),score=47.35 NODE_4285_length_689_cov_265.376972:3-521(+)